MFQTMLINMTMIEIETRTAITMPIATRGMGFKLTDSMNAIINPEQTRRTIPRKTDRTSAPRVLCGRRDKKTSNKHISMMTKTTICATPLVLANEINRDRKNEAVIGKTKKQ